MKYCPKCGYSTADERQRFCLNCGLELQNGMSYNQGGEYGYSSARQNTFPMKWYKFLIYFALFFGALFNIVYGIHYISGGIYFIQNSGEVTAEMVYSLFGRSLELADKCYGIVLLGLAVLAIITRFKLAAFKKEAPGYVYFLNIVNIVSSLIYSIIVANITDNPNVITNVMGSVIGVVITTVCNYKYFNRRKELFCN